MLTTRQRDVTTSLTYWAAEHRHASEVTSLPADHPDRDKLQRLGLNLTQPLAKYRGVLTCPLTFAYGRDVEWVRLLPRDDATGGEDDHEPLLLWLSKVANYKLDSNGQISDSLSTIFPLHRDLVHMLTTRSAVLLPTIEVLSGMAIELEQRLAEKLNKSGEGGGGKPWTLDVSFRSKERGGMACKEDFDRDRSSCVYAHMFTLINLPGRDDDEEVGPIFRDTLLSSSSDRARYQPHWFLPLEQGRREWPAKVEPPLPDFPAYLDLPLCVGLFLWLAREERKIDDERWGGEFREHFKLVDYVSLLLSAGSIEDLCIAQHKRPASLPGKHVSLETLLEERGESKEAMRAVTRVYEREEVVLRGWLEGREKGRKRGMMECGEEEGLQGQRGGGSKRRASEVEDGDDGDDDGTGTGEDTMLSDPNGSEAAEALEPSEPPARLTRQAYKRASQKLAFALATAFGDGRGRFRPEYLLQGWDAIYRTVGPSQAAVLAELRREKAEARSAWARAREERAREEEAEDED